ncbi:hypothetical protein HN51_061533 [Arachis hypogaea]|uniref:cytochrome P450 87A3 isoform X1 n=1 Tax=Arachis ipaensis TaxID=130454 RepID=UPI0007AF323D|nr:cytochrome P450 87A3 isoform X1 [Arachis ipaensis]XP_025626789.1 cytochrome P450 87A3 [Arachis hypogaea]QHO18806.1 Cytochrome P450 [Arachis hypogaea]
MWILMGLCIVAVLVIYVFHWIIILTDPKFRNRSSLPPGSMGFPFIGETLQFMIPSYSLDIHPFITKRIQRFGSIFRTSLFGQPIVISTDSEFNSYLMQQEGKLVELWAGPATKIFRQSDGFRIPFSNIHKYIRSITLNHIGAECIREKLISQFEEMFIKTLHQWSTQTSIDVKQSITKMNFRFFAKHYFGYDIENLSSNFERISEELFTDFTERLKTIPLNIPGTNYHKCLKEWRKAFKIIKNILEERRNSPEKYRGDFLDQAINDMEKDKIMNDDQIVYLVLGIWFANSASISSMAQLIFKFLSEYPSVVEELRVEHEQILRSRDKSRTSSLTWNEYKSMKFTQHVMNETLRFSILLPGILRKTLKDIHFKEYIIPANWIILAFTPNLHMNSEIYEDPLTFNPWRWKELDSFTVSKNFKPFGGGLTQCPGAELSRAFIATFLHVLVTKYRWTKIKGGKVVRNPILEFSDRIHIKIWENREKT